MDKTVGDHLTPHTRCVYCGQHVNEYTRTGRRATQQQILDACTYHHIQHTDNYMICHHCRQHPPHEQENLPAPPPPPPTSNINTHEQQLVTNVKAMMVSMPKHAHLRQPLVQLLSNNIPNRVAANILSTSPSTVNKAKHDNKPNPILTVKYKQHTTRQKVAQQEIDEIKHHIMEECPPKSGCKRPRYRQLVPTMELYDGYVKQHMERCMEQQHNTDIRDMLSCIFVKLDIPNIIVSYIGMYVCPDVCMYACIYGWMYGCMDVYVCVR
jgi:hypothetical protein